MKKKKIDKHQKTIRQTSDSMSSNAVLRKWIGDTYSLWRSVPLWTVVFWAWVVWVSFWIDQAPAEQIDELKTGQQLLDIQFKGMRFEQKYTNGMQLVVESPSAWIDEETQTLFLEKPVLTQMNEEDDVYQASGDYGEVQLQLNRSSLPSSFDQLTITGNAYASSGATAVKTDKMIFDCETQLFFCPDRFEFDRGGLKINSENKMYDPREKRMSNPD